MTIKDRQFSHFIENKLLLRLKLFNEKCLEGGFVCLINPFSNFLCWIFRLTNARSKVLFYFPNLYYDRKKYISVSL